MIKSLKYFEDTVTLSGTKCILKMLFAIFDAIICLVTDVQLIPRYMLYMHTILYMNTNISIYYIFL